MIKKISLLIWLSFNLSIAQTNTIHIHSHNDYKRVVPFWQALSAGAKSIEADIILKDNELYVAHEIETIEEYNTLENLYLSPLQGASSLRADLTTDLQLLVDIKSNSQNTLAVLINQLKPYKSILKPYNPLGITIVISGNRPAPSTYNNYPKHIYFDCQEIAETPASSWNKVAMVSTSFSNLSGWNGLGRMVESDLAKVESFVLKAHSKNKPIRFWATPDTKTSWSTFYNLGVNYINTDKPEQAVSFINKLPDLTFDDSVKTDDYNPTFDHDVDSKQIKNVIFLIGDGMGLTQVSSGDFVTKGKLNMSKLESIGLVRTHSADNFGTDSAAGATAYATGVSTKNRAIGVGVNDETLTNITDLLANKEYTTGIITTDHVIGATPAAFYAHTKERDDKKTITRDLVRSNINFFAGAGQEDFNLLLPDLNQKFKIINDDSEINQFKNNNHFGYFLSNSGLKSMEDGRGDIMPSLLREVLPLFKEKGKPFFLMAEGAKIDSFGHTNNAGALIREVVDFDKMVGEALKFADLDGETLVIITADHETGGFSLPNGDLNTHSIEGDFNSHDHTGTMVPIFAYGPGAALFQGVYKNTDVHKKLLQLIN